MVVVGDQRVLYIPNAVVWARLKETPQNRLLFLDHEAPASDPRVLSQSDVEIVPKAVH